MTRSHRVFVAIALGAFALWANATDVKVGKQDLGGVVMGPTGPEAGVRGIAETKDLPTNLVVLSPATLVGMQRAALLQDKDMEPMFTPR